MIILSIVVGVLLWLYVGWKGFIYWWTADLPVTRGELSMGIVSSLFGPTWYIVAYVERPSKGKHKDDVVYKKRDT